jgi:hypothetical protein
LTLKEETASSRGRVPLGGIQVINSIGEGESEPGGAVTSPMTRVRVTNSRSETAEWIASFLVAHFVNSYLDIVARRGF